MSARKTGRRYGFGSFELDADQGLLRSREGEIALTPKAFETLVALIDRPGVVIPKDELMNIVWPDAIVDENNLAQNISLVRKALSVAEPDVEYVQTVPRRGYRFVGQITRSEDVVQPSEPPATARARTHYATSGDLRIAYQVVGEGPIDIVFVMGWVSHLEMFWEEPHFAAFLNELAKVSRLILFDKRGTGLSDSVPLSQLPTLEQRMDDVRAVMNAAGSERAVLMGVSEGATMSCLFAATYPEMTSGVIVIGGYSRRLWAPDYPWGPTAEARDRWIEAMERSWGGPVGIEERAPTLADDPAFRSWWAKYLRMGASPGAAGVLTRMNAEIDIRPILPSIGVPTLIIHRRDDRCLKVEEGRYMAERIPGARFLELEGEDHLPFVGDQASILEPVRRFVSELRAPSRRTLILATVLEIRLDSPQPEEHSALKKLESDAGLEISWHRGTVVGGRLRDGITATFDGPARAIRCARAIVEMARQSGLTVTAGLHTGECDLVEGKVAGIAVGIATRVAAEAAPGDVVVSHTVRDLVAGSGIDFDSPRTADFEAFGQWQLSRVRPES